MIQSQNNVVKIRLIMALISLLLSILALYSDDIINSDGIMYIELSQAYLDGGLIASAKVYNWPFFSILVALIHQITQLSLETSTYVLNTILFVLLTDVLVLISNKILPNSRQLAFAALFFLCFLTLNEYRDFIIRDIGYWAFCSLALYQFMKFLEKSTLKNATIWQAVIIVAILFRVEGIVIFFGLPASLFFIQSPKIAIKNTIQLYYIAIISTLLLILFAVGLSDLTTTFNKITTVTNYINLDILLSKLDERIDIMGSQILNKHSDSYGALILSSGLIVMLIYKLIKAVSIGYIGLYFYSRWQKISPQPSPYQGLIGYFLILNIVILLAFLFTEYFVSKRYAMVALISILLLMMPRLCNIMERAWTSKNKPILIIAGLILFVGLVDGMTKSNSKLYIKDVAIWASDNLPENSTVLTDDEFIQYYFSNNQPKATLSVKNIQLYKKYDYLIVVDKRKNKYLKAMLGKMDIKPTYNSKNKRGDQATVYEVRSPKIESAHERVLQ